MKQKSFMVLVILITAVASGVFAQRGNLSNEIADLPLEDLSDAEIQGLLLMREEEKLARDVYLTLYEQWNIRAFSNIARSEETHMGAVGQLLERYGIDDPIANDGIGIFTDPRLGALYDDLVREGSASSLDALKVGAKVEELDIFDLQRLLESADNQDIYMVYQNLLKGSRNHLRTFDGQIGRAGGSYEPEFLGTYEYAQIAAGSRETGAIGTD